MTEDHSLINDDIPHEARERRKSETGRTRTSSSAPGMKESVQVDIFTEKPHIGDTICRCSDGLHRHAEGPHRLSTS